jgi:hypothetical protein
MNNTLKVLVSIVPLSLAGAIAVGCGSGPKGPSNEGVQGSPEVKHPDVPGTVVTILLENHDQSDVISDQMPYVLNLSKTFSTANAYISSTHPSLPNYIELTSGQTFGIDNDDDPKSNTVIQSTENLHDQLEAAGITWRAYMEDMGAPCNFYPTGKYMPHHNPFLYYASVANDPARCNEHVVDFATSFDDDLASGKYRYMWISPNSCNDMHDCSGGVVNGWLEGLIPKIQASPGYQNGGAIFILTDEGGLRIQNAAADLAAIVVSPKLVRMGYSTDTRFDHSSYVATIEDIFRLPRMGTTVGATPMDEIFRLQTP